MANNPEDYLQAELADFTIIGAYLFAQGATEFEAWSKAMLAEDFSETIRPYLETIYENSRIILEETKKAFEE